MNIRYFLQGDVRKFGDQIKISCSLLDIESLDHLWQIAHKGTMNDIFDMQEEVAKKVVEGLKIHLLAGEQEKLSSRGTANAEAYELYLKAAEFYDRGSTLDIEYALKAIAGALELDPTFDKALLRRAIILIAYHEMNTGKAELLDEAEQLIERAKRRISPEEDWRILGGQAILASIRGDAEKCLALHLENIRIGPDDPYRHDALGSFFAKEGRIEEAIREFETVLTIKPDGYPWARALIGFAWYLKRHDRKVEYAHRYVGLFEKRTKIAPDDIDAAIVYGLLLFYSGKLDAAGRQLDSISDDHIRDEYAFRNAASLAACVGQPQRAISLLERLLAIEFDSDAAEWHQWLDESEFDPIRESEAFIRVKQAFEDKRRQHG